MVEEKRKRRRSVSRNSAPFLSGKINSSPPAPLSCKTYQDDYPDELLSSSSDGTSNTDNFVLKENGLIKKTISISIPIYAAAEEEDPATSADVVIATSVQHLVCYGTKQDFVTGTIVGDSRMAEIAQSLFYELSQIPISSDLAFAVNFRKQSAAFHNENEMQQQRQMAFQHKRKQAFSASGENIRFYEHHSLASATDSYSIQQQQYTNENTDDLSKCWNIQFPIQQQQQQIHGSNSSTTRNIHIFNSNIINGSTNNVNATTTATTNSFDEESQPKFVSLFSSSRQYQEHLPNSCICNEFKKVSQSPVFVYIKLLLVVFIS